MQIRGNRAEGSVEDHKLDAAPSQRHRPPKTMANLLNALESHELSQDDFLSELCELRVDSVNPAACNADLQADFSLSLPKNPL